MAKFVLYMTVKTKTRRLIAVEAENEEAAIEMVQEHDFDLRDSVMVDSFLFSVDDVTCERSISYGR